MSIENAIQIIRADEGVLYILCGYPYAGKSYIANQIAKETNTAIVSIDDIFYGIWSCFSQSIRQKRAKSGSI